MMIGRERERRRLLDAAFASISGRRAVYMIVFCCCAVACLVGWTCMKSLVPHYKKVEL